MILDILIGSILIILTIIVEVIFIETGQLFLNRRGNTVLGAGTYIRKIVVLTGATLWLLAALSLAIWIWAIGFYVIDAFDTFEAALYFSMVCFTTLGFGDVLLDEEWRLLSGIIATNGLILVGLNTAVLFDVMSRMRDGDMRTYRGK